MQVNLNSLHKRAIDLALGGNWKEAITLNKQILEKDPENIETKNRLGRAYIQTKDFAKAQKIFKAVLGIDPVNIIAKKNLDLATKRKSEDTNSNLNPQVLIRESGTTYELEENLATKEMSAADFTAGEKIEVKVGKKSVKFFKQTARRGEIMIVETTSPLIVQRLNTAKKVRADISVIFVRGKGNYVTLLLKSSVPVFPGQKQAVRPYLKKGSLDEEEPEIEIPVQEREII